MTTKENKFVTMPLYKWFTNRKPDWEFHLLKHPTSARGWDLEGRQKNRGLFIEAKFIDGPFASSFSGLVTAPLPDRKSYFMKRKDRSWSYSICWAIGTSYKKYKKKRIYQNVLDYFARNLQFWKHYCRDLHVDYVYFVNCKEKVAEVPFRDLLDIASSYKKLTNGKQRKKRKERQDIAKELMAKYEYN